MDVSLWQFVKEWAKRAVRGPWGWARTVGFIGSIIVGIIKFYWPKLGMQLDWVPWFAPIVIFGGLTFLSFIRAAYTLYEEKDEEVKRLHGIVPTITRIEDFVRQGSSLLIDVNRSQNWEPNEVSRIVVWIDSWREEVFQYANTHAPEYTPYFVRDEPERDPIATQIIFADSKNLPTRAGLAAYVMARLEILRHWLVELRPTRRNLPNVTK